MNREIADSLIQVELNRLRTMSYSELVKQVGNPEVKDVVAEDGNTYSLEIESFWDSKEGGDVRGMVAADDGGWRSFVPLTFDFIMRPDGTLVGE